MKKIVLGTTFTVLTLVGVIYHFQNKSHTDHVEIPYIKAIYSKPVSYDPAQMNDGASLIFSELVYEGLLRFDESYGIQAGIAESWETSEDGRLITFRLNPNGFKPLFVINNFVNHHISIKDVLNPCKKEPLEKWVSIFYTAPKHQFRNLSEQYLYPLINNMEAMACIRT